MICAFFKYIFSCWSKFLLMQSSLVWESSFSIIKRYQHQCLIGQTDIYCLFTHITQEIVEKVSWLVLAFFSKIAWINKIFEKKLGVSTAELPSATPALLCLEVLWPAIFWLGAILYGGTELQPHIYVIGVSTKVALHNTVGPDSTPTAKESFTELAV